MPTQTVCKHIYIQERQEALLKRLSQVRGASEAEGIRQAIEHEATSAPAQRVTPDRSARFCTLSRPQS